MAELFDCMVENVSGGLSRIPVSAPLDVRNRSLAIIESIAATASDCCRSSLGLGIVIANVLPPAVLKVNLSTMLVVTTMRRLKEAKDLIPYGGQVGWRSR